VKLQLALDGDLACSLDILRAARPYVDLAELGTPLIFRHGLEAARAIRAAFPDLPLLADLKIMDAGEHEAALAFEAGCQWVTVLGVAHNHTVEGALAAARAAGGAIMADLMQVADPVARGRELLARGCDVLCVHTAYDVQASGADPLADLARLRAALPDARLAVAGGIRADTVDRLAPFRPEIVVVGGAIVNADDPARAARTLAERIKRCA